MMQHPWLHLLAIYSLFLLIPLSSSQFDSPRNIETFYPFQSPPISPPQIPATPNNPNHVQPLPKSSSSSNKTVIIAVIATAASTLVLAGICFFFIQKRSIARKEKREKVRAGLYRSGPVAPAPQFFDGNLKGYVIDENGLDVVYWRKLEGVKYKNSYRKEVFNHHKNGENVEKSERNNESSPIQQSPLLHGMLSMSEISIFEDRNQNSPEIPAVLLPPPPIMTPPPPPPPPPPPIKTPPPPPIPSKNRLPPPPPPGPGPPRPPPGPGPPRPPPGPGPVRKLNNGSKKGDTSKDKAEIESGQVKMKPLHWDKVNASTDHSMVWHKLDKGSFTFDGDLMEALFGSAVKDHHKTNTNTNTDSSKTSTISSSLPAAQIFILESRKSQNTAIVLRSLTISRSEILDALMEGRGLNTDTLEKLTRIAPAKEEESQIIGFDGDPTKLADAESFLYHLLKSVPTAFPRLETMLFRSNFVFEILHLKEIIQTLESGCKELKTCGLFLKLLEAVLKSGNRMNAGTSRGNAQAFNLTALRKLSDVKSSDGKITLLHFVVEEVVRSEGKKCLMNLKSQNLASNQENETDYIKLGLPIVGGLSSKFSNVRQSAVIDYDSFSKTCSVLTSRLAETKQIVAQCSTSRGGGFVSEMNGFTESADGELKEVRASQTRVMELVKKTTEYYQAGNSNSKHKEANQLQLFVIVRDFLGMVDKVCVDIARNMQKKRTPAGSSSALPKSPPRSTVKFPILPEHFMSEKSRSSSSESSSGDDSS